LSNDTSAVVSFGSQATGYKIGIMWDDTNTKNATRQILLLAPEQDRIFMIAENPKSGLFVWESSLSAELRSGDFLSMGDTEPEHPREPHFHQATRPG
jgi:hypothetical protein